jgi:hypothetical protein
MFQRHARVVSANPSEAEDLCQDACLKVLSNLPRLRNPKAFRAWAFAIIRNEARKRNKILRKAGTSFDELTLTHQESMRITTGDVTAGDLSDLEGLLLRHAQQLDEPRRQTAMFMLDHYAREGKLPPVRSIAAAIRRSHGAAQRLRQASLRGWQRLLSALGLAPGSQSAKLKHQSMTL